VPLTVGIALAFDHRGEQSENFITSYRGSNTGVPGASEMRVPKHNRLLTKLHYLESWAFGGACAGL